MGTRQRITEELVRRVPHLSRTTFIRDNQLIGFALRITTAGAKSFIAEARVNGRMCRFTIGPVERFTVVEARDKAKALLAGMTSGLDPRIARRASRQRSDTLQAMLDGYIDARSIKASTAGKYRALMRRNLSDWLERPIADITPQMALVRYEDLCRTSVASANVTMRSLCAVCRRAIKILPDRHDGAPVMKRIPTESLAGNWRVLGPQDDTARAG
jgi:Arm DNA-binding domain